MSMVTEGWAKSISEAEMRAARQWLEEQLAPTRPSEAVEVYDWKLERPRRFRRRHHAALSPSR